MELRTRNKCTSTKALAIASIYKLLIHVLLMVELYFEEG
jgi:hypothetical protein